MLILKIILVNLFILSAIVCLAIGGQKKYSYQAK